MEFELKVLIEVKKVNELDNANLAKTRKKTERAIEAAFFLCALFAVLSVVFIAFYILARGIPAIREIGISNFLFGNIWEPTGDFYGIWPMIVGSIYATLGAVIIGLPIGVFTAIFLAEIAPEKIAGVLRTAINLLAGIPSVVYGFFGLVVIVPFIDKVLGGGGNSLLATVIILSIMILPTIVNLSETAIRAVPRYYKEGSLGLGATHIETIFKVILPAAKSGILASIVLGVGRAVGETMAVILVSGNTPLIPASLLDRLRTMTATIAMEMSYSSGLHQEALFGIGVVLFIFIMLLNLMLNYFTSKMGGDR